MEWKKRKDLKRRAKVVEVGVVEVKLDADAAKFIWLANNSRARACKLDLPRQP